MQDKIHRLYSTHERVVLVGNQERKRLLGRLDVDGRYGLDPSGLEQRPGQAFVNTVIHLWFHKIL